MAKVILFMRHGNFCNNNTHRKTTPGHNNKKALIRTMGWLILNKRSQKNGRERKTLWVWILSYSEWNQLLKQNCGEMKSNVSSKIVARWRSDLFAVRRRPQEQSHNRGSQSLCISGKMLGQELAAWESDPKCAVSGVSSRLFSELLAAAVVQGSTFKPKVNPMTKTTMHRLKVNQPWLGHAQNSSPCRLSALISIPCLVMPKT